MKTVQLEGGVVHTMPNDFRDAIVGSDVAHKLWDDITPLARNEWICWIEDAKKAETRTKRINVGLDKMHKGMRRPCCWAGCTHRTKNGVA